MSNGLTLRPAEGCRFDIVTLGEVMIRFDPGAGRVRTARTFAVSEGGGEYNVGRALRRTFGHRVATVTAVGNNDVGWLLEDLLQQGGTNLDHIVRKDTDEVGRQHRTPLNFTERGFGVRAPRGVYDRAHSATASLQPEDVDWDALFGELGARWFHTGAIFAGLSDATLATLRVAMAAARANGTIVSYDVNYRPSLWRAAGGSAAHRELTNEIVKDVDVLLGVDNNSFDTDVADFAATAPGLSIVATTRRHVHSSSTHDWGATGWSRADGQIESRTYERLDVFDRVGGGDGFASGLIHGLLTNRSLSEALELGLAHGALVMTTPGDTSSADAAEVEHLAAGGDSTIAR